MINVSTFPLTLSEGCAKYPNCYITGVATTTTTTTTTTTAAAITTTVTCSGWRQNWNQPFLTPSTQSHCKEKPACPRPSSRSVVTNINPFCNWQFSGTHKLLSGHHILVKHDVLKQSGKSTRCKGLLAAELLLQFMITIIVRFIYLT